MGASRLRSGAQSPPGSGSVSRSDESWPVPRVDATQTAVWYLAASLSPQRSVPAPTRPAPPPTSIPLVGFALALVYPMGLIWYTALIPHDGDGVALLILCMMAGGVIGPAIESVMVSSFGIRVVPVVLCGFALACLAVFRAPFASPRDRARRMRVG